MNEGCCIWLTGLSGAGKTTVGMRLSELLEDIEVPVTLLDGDEIRTNLSKGLGFSKEDRDTHVKRVGYVASLILKHGGIVICALISPYRNTRMEVRELIGDHFVEVFTDASQKICEQRDVKGLYAKARKGEIKNFTGVSDPYEPPDGPDIILDTVNKTSFQCATEVYDYLIKKGYIYDE